MQLRLTSLDKILSDLIFGSTGFAHSPSQKHQFSVFYTVKPGFSVPTQHLILMKTSVERIKHPGGAGLTLPVAEVSSGSKDLWKSSPSLLIMV